MCCCCVRTECALCVRFYCSIEICLAVNSMSMGKILCVPDPGSQCTHHQTHCTHILRCPAACLPVWRSHWLRQTQKKSLQTKAGEYSAGRRAKNGSKMEREKQKKENTNKIIYFIVTLHEKSHFLTILCICYRLHQTWTTMGTDGLAGVHPTSKRRMEQNMKREHFTNRPE